MITSAGEFRVERPARLEDARDEWDSLAAASGNAFAKSRRVRFGDAELAGVSVSLWWSPRTAAPAPPA